MDNVKFAMNKLSSVGFDPDSDLLLMKLLHPDLCKLSEDDRLQFRQRLLQLLRNCLAPKEDENLKDSTPPAKKVKIEPKNPKRSVDINDVITLDD